MVLLKHRYTGMRFFSFLIFCIFIFQNSCQTDNKKNGRTSAPSSVSGDARLAPLYGNWIAIDFCAYCSQYGSVLTAMNNTHLPYAFALTFKESDRDSVLCYNATESWKRPIRFTADTLIEILDARRTGKSVFVAYSPSGNKDLTMYDATQAKTSLDRFTKTNVPEKTGAEAFKTALNHQLMGGEFASTGKSRGTVRFLPTGEITGLEGYDRYEICTGGNCFIAGQDSDVLILSDSKGQKPPLYAGFKFDPNRTALTLYELKNEKSDQKGSARPGATLYKFTRTSKK